MLRAQYASGLVSGLTKIATTEGISSLYAGFLPILAKQVPYAIGQFTVNERCVEFIYNRMTPEQKEKLSPTGKFSVALTSGIVAGLAAAVLSHVCLHLPSAQRAAGREGQGWR